MRPLRHKPGRKHFGGGERHKVVGLLLPQSKQLPIMRIVTLNNRSKACFWRLASYCLGRLTRDMRKYCRVVNDEPITSFDIDAHALECAHHNSATDETLLRRVGQQKFQQMMARTRIPEEAKAAAERIKKQSLRRQAPVLAQAVVQAARRDRPAHRGSAEAAGFQKARCQGERPRVEETSSSASAAKGRQKGEGRSLLSAVRSQCIARRTSRSFPRAACMAQRHRRQYGQDIRH